MDPVSIGLGLVSAGSGIAGLMSGNSQARAAERSANKAIAETKRQYDQTRADLAGYRDLGNFATTNLQQGIESGAYNAPTFGFTAGQYSYDPNTDTALQQALQTSQRAIQSSAAARGLLGGGGVLKGLNADALSKSAQFENQAYNRFQNEENTRYGRATDAYNRSYGATQDAANRLQALSGMGLSAATQTGQFGQNAASQIGQLGIQGATEGAAYRGAGQEQLWKGLGAGLGYLSGSNGSGATSGTRWT